MALEEILGFFNDLQASVAEIRQRVTILRSELNQIRGDLEAQLKEVEGSIGQKLTRPELKSELSQIRGDLQAQLKGVEGSIGQKLTHPELKSELNQIRGALEAQLKGVEGSIGQKLTRPELKSELSQIRSALEAQLKEVEGSIGQKLTRPELKSELSQIRSALEAQLKEVEGSIGQKLTRPELKSELSQIRSDLQTQLKDVEDSIGQKLTQPELKSELNQIRGDVQAQLKEVQDSIGQKLTQPESKELSPLLDLAHVNEVVQKLALGETREQILEVYLRETQERVNRAILFLEKEGRYVPWKGIGFSSESIELVAAEETEDPIIRAASQKKIICRSEAVGEAFPWLKEAGPLPQVVICIPLVFGDYVPAVFYGDSFQSISVDPLELLTHLAVLVLKNHSLQNQIPHQPSESSEGTAEDLEKTVEEMASLTPAQSQQEAPQLPRTEEEKEKPVVSSVDPGRAQSEEAGEEEERKSEEEAEVTGLREMISMMASVTPTQFQPGPESLGESSEAPEGTAEEKKRHHNEAWRLARRLVNEIKLLNAEEVAAGRQSKDLYKRLRNKIDGGRHEYERKVHPSVGEQFDYFHREMVRMLADGDETLLGLDYPGPLPGAQ